MNPWELIKRRLQSTLSAESFQNWIYPTALIRIEGDALQVAVPDEPTRSWLENELQPDIRAALKAVSPGLARVVYEIRAIRSLAPGPKLVEAPEVEFAAHQLIDHFTFDNFVVGACNQFAHAAARAVATSPARSYNPLFLYGGVGLGKTHLMHAIGQALKTSFVGLRIMYTSSERFLNEMVSCVRTNRMSLFQQRYRSADVLLVDDIEVLGNKERTQEEFFHTFNELHNLKRQIVISSDSPPKEIPGLLDRLRSRFEWGLIADMQPPDLETKMAILDRKAEAQGAHLPEDVRSFLAIKIKGNVRELEGGLTKLLAYSSLTGVPLTLPLAQQLLRNIVHQQDRRVSIDFIQKAVAEYFNIKQPQLKEKSNARDVVYPRQVAMYLVKELTTASLPEIGRAFGGKHHTTVLHSILKIAELRRTDVELNRLLNNLIDSFQ
ncbi:MAG: chromosomal replication initiator protein DnaA [Acidobacteria bacterium]|nr:chromosomal replication initiator protein DnaA [Acidobacteriota bacterium]